MNKMKQQPVSGRRKGRKRGSRLRHYKHSILMICMVLVFLSGALAIGSISLHAKNAEYKAQEEELEAQIKDEEKRAKEVDEFEDYVKTDDYIKETAEDKLGMVDPDEIIFKPSTNENSGRILPEFSLCAIRPEGGRRACMSGYPTGFL